MRDQEGGMEGRRRKNSNIESGSQPWGLCMCIKKKSFGRSLQHAGSPTRDQTHASCIVSVES